MNDNLEMIQKIEALCKIHNTDVKNMLLACELNRNTIDNMKKGSAPAINKIEKIANYFNVSVDYLLGRTDSESEIKEQLTDVYLSFAKNAQDEGIDPDDIMLAIETIKAMRRKHEA